MRFNADAPKIISELHFLLNVTIIDLETLKFYYISVLISGDSKKTKARIKKLLIISQHTIQLYHVSFILQIASMYTIIQVEIFFKIFLFTIIDSHFSSCSVYLNASEKTSSCVTSRRAWSSLRTNAKWSYTEQV